MPLTLCSIIVEPVAIYFKRLFWRGIFLTIGNTSSGIYEYVFHTLWMKIQQKGTGIINERDDRSCVAATVHLFRAFPIFVVIVMFSTMLTVSISIFRRVVWLSNIKRLANTDDWCRSSYIKRYSRFQFSSRGGRIPFVVCLCATHFRCCFAGMFEIRSRNNFCCDL